MEMQRRHDSFVCIDEITDTIEPMNYVIYNPSKDSIPFRSELLYRRIKERFNIELTSEELIELTKYEVQELSSFVKQLKAIINERR